MFTCENVNSKKEEYEKLIIMRRNVCLSFTKTQLYREQFREGLNKNTKNKKSTNKHT